MNTEHRLAQRPMALGLAAILAVVLGFSALVGFGGTAFAQTDGTATPSASTTSTTSGSNAAASPTSPATGSGVAAGGSSSSAIILIGGLVVVGGSLAAMGCSLRKNS